MKFAFRAWLGPSIGLLPNTAIKIAQARSSLWEARVAPFDGIILADAVDRCRDEDMRTPEVLAALDLLARRTSIRWPFEQFKESLNFAIGDPSHAEGRWQNVHASLNAIRRAVGVV